MATIDKIKIGDTTYNIKDSSITSSTVTVTNTHSDTGTTAETGTAMNAAIEAKRYFTTFVAYSTTTKTLSNNTVTSVTSFTLPAGRWLIRSAVRIKSPGTTIAGYNAMVCVQTTAPSSTPNSASMHGISMYTDGYCYNIQYVSVSANTTYYLYACTNTGSSTTVNQRNVTGIRIGDA